MYIYICVCVYAYTYLYVYLRICVCIRVYICVHMYVYIYTITYMCMCVSHTPSIYTRSKLTTQPPYTHQHRHTLRPTHARAFCEFFSLCSVRCRRYPFTKNTRRHTRTNDIDADSDSDTDTDIRKDRHRNT